jgi:hypothetical protein
MKSLSGRLGVILIGIIIFGCAEVRGDDWKSLNTTESGVNYYNAESITRLPKNIVRVWVKAELSEKGVKDMVATLGKRYAKLSYVLFLNEIDCGERASRLLSVVVYSEDGSVINRVDSPNQFTYILPETLDNYLYKAVCK